jgi:uncharacterized coiled-coil DUF342 family protein
MMNRMDDPIARAELGALEFRLERIEQLLSEEVLSAEMEAQLRHTISVVQTRIQGERACRFHDPRTRAAA